MGRSWFFSYVPDLSFLVIFLFLSVVRGPTSSRNAPERLSGKKRETPLIGKAPLFTFSQVCPAVSVTLAAHYEVHDGTSTGKLLSSSQSACIINYAGSSESKHHLHGKGYSPEKRQVISFIVRFWGSLRKERRLHLK